MEKKINEQKMTMEVELYDDEGNEYVATLSIKFEVCPRCNGTGSHINPSIDGHGISAEEWEHDWADEEKEMYMNGGYDVPCYECEGLRVVPEVYKERCNKDDLARYTKALEEDAAYNHMCEMERKYGA